MIFGVVLGLIVLTRCGEDSTVAKVNEKPELAPICPEGYYWLDTIKSCVILEDDMME